MALIYTYPRITTIADDDLFLITDVNGSNTSVKPTKSVTLATIKQATIGSVDANYIPVSDGSVFVDSVMFQEPGTAYGTTKNVVIAGNIYQSDMGESVSIGNGALINGVAGTTGENVAIGRFALSALTTGTNNIAIGTETLRNASNGVASRNNIAIGKNSQFGATTGEANISLGFNSLSQSNAGSRNVVIGHTATQNTTSSSDISGNVILGPAALANGITAAGEINNNVVIGESAANNLATSNFRDSVIIGYKAGQSLQGVSEGDVGIGLNAFFGSANGFSSNGNNIAIGTGAQGNNTTSNIAGSIKIGSDAGLAGDNAVNISTVSVSIGQANNALGSHGALIGGYNNNVSSQAGFIGAGHDNTISSNATGGAILGGYNNTINGTGSAGMALGSDLVVNGNNQVVVGRYNISTNDSKFLVGAGSSGAARKNALDVKNTGQLKLGFYGETPANFPAGNIIFNNIKLLGVSGISGPNGNVVEIEPSALGEFSQTITPTAYTVSQGFTVNLPGTIGKLALISWVGQNGNAILRLPAASNFTNKYVQIVTDVTFDQGPALTNLSIETPFGSGETIDGNPNYLMSLAYRSVTFWSTGSEYIILDIK